MLTSKPHFPITNPMPKATESAGMVARDHTASGGSAKDASDILKKASAYYRENGNIDKATDVLSKAAKVLESDSGATDDAAAALYIEAVDMVIEGERETFNMDLFKQVTLFLLKAKRWQEAHQIYEKQVRAMRKLSQLNAIYKIYLSRIIICLSCNDYVAATNMYDSFSKDDEGFWRSSEGQAAQELLSAFRERSEDALKKALSNQMIGFLEMPIVRLAKAFSLGPSGKGGNSGDDSDIL
mmetsp:Transcript_45372/g.73918  ORF Transcript_45372/g.73918 Transcript_45372/m.73918 type:complete len:240 (+) Transcript_45372:193-912(+)